MISVASGVALLGLAACSPGKAPGGQPGGGEPATTSANAGAPGLKDFDPCAFFTSADLSAAGVGGQGEKIEQLKFEPGCSYEGEDRLVTLYKNEQETVGKYQTDGKWDSYERFNLNGRNAAHAVAAGSSGRGICSVLVDAGGGVVQIKVSGITKNDVPDPCGEAEKVARQVESRLPQ
ncbi:DUF3558 family protein [Saccharopolyspora shandongensis]|uniref:DUF3558 family protein n=1 Tax=Saccharopolyspora shandongensis TaxID=418495 RepID=UPI0033F819E5